MSSVESVARAGDLPHEAAGLTADDLLQIYYFMQLTRSCEEAVRRLYLQGKLVGAVYTSRGQEGTAVASAYALRDGDYCAPLIRDLGASFTRGVDPRALFAQWLGRAPGPSGGRDGNLHFGVAERGVLAPISMLGATIPLCAGVALAARQRGEDRVAMAYIGDGGSNTGDFHEGLNFAAVLKLPLVLILEDNGFAYSTPTGKHAAVRTFADRAAAYGIPGVTIDGNDVIAVYDACHAAVQRARAGEGPTLIEVKTFRMRGHAEHDDAFYVPKGLHEEWAARDPVDRLLAYLREHLPEPEAAIAGIDERVTREIREALDWALDAPMPDGATQSLGVYA
jgi:acetoin:2,6-dichlorophenolindophenol oxidoreductase subunit alpha